MGIIKVEKIEERLEKEEEVYGNGKFEDFEKMNQKKEEKLNPSVEDPPD